MKRSFLIQLLFGALILCSVASYVYLSAQQGEAPQPNTEAKAVVVEENPEVILPDMALFQKLIDATKVMSSYTVN